MNEEHNKEPDRWMVAVHEAGHLIVGVLRGRKLKCVSLEAIEGQRGCFWDLSASAGLDQLSEMLGLLAGPRCQVACLPGSIDPDKLEMFQSRVIQPQTNRWEIPAKIYDYTGWQFDVGPVYSYLAWSEAPSDQSGHVPRRTVVERAEEMLLRFFAD